MNDVIIKLHEEGWKIADNSNGVVAWKELGTSSERQMMDAILICGKQPSICDFTDSAVFNIDMDSSELKPFLLKHKILPANFNELQLIANFINV